MGFRAVILGLFVIGALNAQIPKTNQIQSVKMMTGDCKDCGMDESNSQLDLEVCGYMGLLYVCCDTGSLDNIGVDDFKPGNISTFRENQT